MLSNFSWVRPGLLAGMGYPFGAPWGALRDEGVGAVLTLTEQPLETDPVEGGFAALHVPLVDFGTPDLDDLARCVTWIDEQIQDGRPVVVHCMAGIGRTGTVLAAWLVRQGLAPEEAIRLIREARPGSVETEGQAEAIRRFAEGGDGAGGETA